MGNLLTDFHRSVLNYGAFSFFLFVEKRSAAFLLSLSIVFKDRYYLAFLHEIILKNAQNDYFCKNSKMVENNIFYILS